MKCPCQSDLEYKNCCEPIIKKTAVAETAEQLMRARYSAHVVGDVAFIRSSLAPESRKDFDEAAVREWSKKSEWLGLKIMRTEAGGLKDNKGVVEFTATYKIGDKKLEHHEVATFRRDPKEKDWLFVDGEAHTHEDGQGHHHHEPIAPVVREEPKIGRNDPCPCGSGQKYKKCHGAQA